MFSKQCLKAEIRFITRSIKMKRSENRRQYWKFSAIKDKQFRLYLFTIVVGQSLHESSYDKNRFNKPTQIKM